MAQLTIQQAFDLAVRHHQAGRLQEAEQLYRQILAQQPTHFDAMHLLGVLASKVGKSDMAVELIQRAIRLKPDFADTHFNLGKALANIGQLDEAIASYRRAVQLKPDDAVAHNNLGVALREKGQLDEAIASYREAIRLKPEYAQAHNNLGLAFKDIGRIDEAIAGYRQAIRTDPNYAAAHSNLGNALMDAGRLDESFIFHRQAVQLKPDLAEAHNNLGNALKNAGQLDEAIACYRQAIRLRPEYAQAHDNLILVLNYHPSYDANMILGELRRWNQQNAEPIRKFIQPHTNDRNPERRLRIGYVSPDFRDHVVGQNLLPLLREHDRAQIEIVCYADVVRADSITEQFRRYADVWQSIVGLSDSRAADLIRKDEIDILVDLTLHTAGNRLAIFARKPAPVQVTFAGYPGSTGLETIDYRLTDSHLDPPGLNDHFYSETSIRLPDSFWCYDPLVTELAVNALPAQTHGHITFGCLNNFCKVNEQVLKLWAQVLKEVDRSRLMMLCPEGNHRNPLLDLLRREGIDLDRIDLIAPRPRRQYMELYHRIDVGLDTFPYGGHTTTLDSFWMGVPVVTLVGPTVVGRAGLSQLTNLGLVELIAHTRQQYVQIAAELAGDSPRLSELRRTLRPRMQASPLMDAPKFARNIETAYRQIWRAWCEMGSTKS